MGDVTVKEPATKRSKTTTTRPVHWVCLLMQSDLVALVLLSTTAEDLGLGGDGQADALLVHEGLAGDLGRDGGAILELLETDAADVKRAVKDAQWRIRKADVARDDDISARLETKLQVELATALAVELDSNKSASGNGKVWYRERKTRDSDSLAGRDRLGPVHRGIRRAEREGE